jgi:hypothetical protein
VLGIPENSGVIVDGDTLASVGCSLSTLITADGREEIASR